MLVVSLAFAHPAPPAESGVPNTAQPPSILLIMADDLGVGEVGFNGQKRIRTPNIDALAAQGLRFSQAYSAAPVCAPARCALLTGRNMAHASIRDNKELQPEGQQPLPARDVTLAEALKMRGYVTACIGKWGLGPPGSEGDPLSQGFDHFFGYNCQRHAHNHYPTWLYRDREKITLKGNVPGNAMGQTYAPDLMRDAAVTFIRENKDQPFLLYFATTIPHAALQVPADSLAEYAGALEETPYDGKQGYQPHATPRAAYAAMVTRLDRDIGELLALLDQLGLTQNTIVIFTSDNGPTFNGGTDSAFFNSTAGLRGLKMQLYEGGIRVPLVVRWPGRIAAGGEIKLPVTHCDLLPTLAAIAGASGEVPADVDGMDLAPGLFGGDIPDSRPPLYWEAASGGFQQAVRIDEFKGVRRDVRKDANAPLELYNLGTDPGESSNIAEEHPDVVARMLAIMRQRTPSNIAEWNP